MWLIRLASRTQGAVLQVGVKKKWSKKRSEPLVSDSLFAKKSSVLSCVGARENSQFIKDTHQTEAWGLCMCVSVSRRGRLSIFHFEEREGGLNFLQAEMIVCTPLLKVGGGGRYQER